MDGNSVSNQELLREVQELRRQLAAAQEAARAREESLRGELRRAEAEQRRLTKALKAAQTEHQRLSATFRAQAEELQAANEELATQAEELQVQSEELQIQNEELLNQNDQLQVQARLLEDQKQELESLAGKLEEERALLQSVLEQMPASVVIAAAPAGPIFLFNHRAMELWPYPLAPFTDLATFWRIRRYHPDGRPYRLKEMPLHRSLTMGEVVEDEEILLQPKDRGPVHLSVSSAPVRDTQGRIVAAVVTHFDITARKRTESALRESEARYRSLVELSPDAILVHNAVEEIVFLNSAAIKLFGASSLEDLLDKRVMDLAHPDVVEKVRDRISHALGGGKTYPEEFKVLRLDGKVVEVEAVGSGVIFQGEPAVQVVFRDITDRKRAREALRAAHQNLQALIQASPLAIVHLNQEGLIQDWNPAAERIFGWHANEVLGRPLPLVPEDKREESRGIIRRAFQGELITGLELRRLRKDGAWIDISLSAAPLHDETGHPTGIVTIAEDISARKQAEAALRDREEELAAIYEHAPLIMLLLDEEWRVRKLNKFAAQFADAPAADLHGRRGGEALRCIHALDDPQGCGFGPHCRQCPVRLTVISTFETSRVHHQVEATLTFTLGGKPQDVTFLLSTALFTIQGQPRVLVTIQDITARQRAEVALRESEASYRTLAQNLPGMVYRVVIGENRMQFFNDAVAELTGYGPDELTHGEVCSIDPLIHPDDRDRVIKVVEDAVAQDEPFEIEYRLIHKNGTLRYFLERGRPIRGADGQPLFIEGVILDFTERHRAEEALRDSRKDLNRAQAVAHTGSWRMDVRRNELFWSDETYRIFGITPGTLLTYEAFLATVHPDDREYVDRQWTAALRGEPYDIEHRIIAGDTVKWVREQAELEFDPQGELLSGFGTVQDITAGKRAEEALRASEAREWARAEELQAVLDAVPGIIFLAQDPECRLITGNPAAYELLNMPPGSNLSKSAREDEPTDHFRVMKDGREVPSEEMPVQRAATGETMRDFEVEVVFADGHGRHILGNAVPLRDEAGRPRGAVAAFVDITARQQAEAALRRTHAELEDRVRQRTADLQATVAQLQEEVMERQLAEEALKTERQRLLAVWEHIPAHVALLRPDYTFALVNGEFVRRLGDPESKRCYELFGQQHPCVECQAMAVFHTRKPVVWEWTAPDGKNYQIYDYPFTDVDGEPLVLEMGVDITQRKQAEQQAASLGRMYRMLSQVNETIVRAEDQETLFRQVCRIMMEAGDFLLAWVGLVDRETRLLKSACQFDLVDEYVQNITIPLDDVPEGRGPTGTAIREGRYDVCPDIAADPRMAPWREQALARGFRSSAAFPLRVGAEIVGALTVYAGRPGFFTADEDALLESLADDLAFALDFMDQEAQRRQAEAALRESEERLRHLASQLLHAQERERHRLSLELHDDLGQSLMVLKMQIRGIEKMLPPTQWQIKQLCDQTQAYLTAVVDNVRRLSRDLRPSILEDLGLAAALRVLADDFRKYYEAELSLDMDDISDLFSREEEINIYRIFQECLTNIAKHAQASQVAITIRRQDDRVAFRVEDNGRGFNLESALTADPVSRGLGLPALEERVHMLGGALEIRSQADRGTTISFTVSPVPTD
jgi:PAS domain S-box-containing protein